MILVMPYMESVFLKDRIPFSKGKNSRAINPIAALTPCILEASVSNSLDSFTLNNPDNRPAPIAKMLIDKNIRQDKEKEVSLVNVI